jgi:endoribonuclease Dicer
MHEGADSLPLMMVPRRYQEEIFLHAINNNVIAAMDTGSGKTLISTLLIKWTTSNETQKKVILFFAPTVALVVQQGHVLSTQTHLRVQTLYGSIVKDMGDRKKWMQVFSEHDVVVMTRGWHVFTSQ